MTMHDVPTQKLIRELQELAETKNRRNWAITAPLVLSLAGILFGIYGIVVVFIEARWPERVPILIGAASVALLLNTLAREKAQTRRLDAMANELDRRR